MPSYLSKTRSLSRWRGSSSLYGLKQAGRVFKDNVKVFMTVFVNDIMLAGSDGALLDLIVKHLSQHFITNLYLISIITNGLHVH